MPNMTGLGKYRKGLDLEQEGLTAKEIAAQLGYKDVQTWYAAKSYYSKRNAAFAARAAGKPDEPKPNPIVEAVNQKREPSWAHDYNAGTHMMATDRPKPRLQRTVQVSAQGEALNYRLVDNMICIRRPEQNSASLSITIHEFLTMIEEVKELLQP